MIKMNYSKLTDAELSEKLFCAVNPDFYGAHFDHTIIGGAVTYEEGTEDAIFFSIFDFADLMPIAIENHVFYEFKLGDDYNVDKYKAVAVFECGHNHVTFDRDVRRAIAICLIKKLAGDGNEKI